MENQRHPIKNFFILARIQREYILRIMGAIFLALTFGIAFIFGVYVFLFKRGDFFFLKDSAVNEDLILMNLQSLLLPALIGVGIFMIIVGLGISLYSSRKIAVPMYKIRRWADDMFSGNLKHKVTIRKGDSIYEMATSCNQVSRKYSEILQDIENKLSNDSLSEEEKIEQVKLLLEPIKY